LKGILLITGQIDGNRTRPINNNLLNWLRQFCGYYSIPLLVEADGSRGKPLKAWAEHEPPIPDFVDVVIHMVGLAGLYKPLNEENVYRSELFSELSGLNLGEPISPAALIKVLTQQEGGLRNIPVNARKVVLLNQADSQELQSVAHGMVPSLLHTYDAAIIASLEQETIYAVHEPVAGIILAAGESKRFGRPKQLLDWKGHPFVHAVAKTALEAGLAPVVVVTGANADQVELAVNDLHVKVIRNGEWQSGQASSIRTGLQAIKGTGAAIFLLTDQPQLTTSILYALVEKHAGGLYPVVAPMVMDQRANPVLFDRDVFSDLMTLQGDVGGRAVFHKYRVEYLPWHDDRLLLDVDTPEMYQRLLSDETL
jgi:molybdenum cofactor cytidylyltransferase